MSGRESAPDGHDKWPSQPADVLGDEFKAAVAMSAAEDIKQCGNQLFKENDPEMVVQMTC